MLFLFMKAKPKKQKERRRLENKKDNIQKKTKKTIRRVKGHFT